MKKKWSQYGFSLLLKLAILGAALYFIFRKFGDKELNFDLVFKPNHLLIVLPLFLVFWFVNLYLDAQIWKGAQGMLEPISRKRAFRINFICYALTFITPIHTGEVVGRYIMMVEKNNRKKALFLTFWSHFPRIISRFIIGLISVAIILIYLEIAPLALVLPLLAIAILLIFILLFSFRSIQGWLATKSFGTLSFEKYLMEDRPSNSEKGNLTLLAGFKYLAYNIQFGLLLFLWSPEVLTVWAFVMIPAYFFITALIPSFALVDFLIKSAVAFWVFAPILTNDELLLTANFVLWFFNWAIPALIGTYIIFSTNILKSLKTKFADGNLYKPEH